MQRWEYEILGVWPDTTKTDLKTMIDNQGAYGWELVGIEPRDPGPQKPARYIFKRPIED